MSENPAAFPLAYNPNDVTYHQDGMTLRDWFAGQAIACSGGLLHLDAPMTAQRAYAIADAMLKERDRDL